MALLNAEGQEVSNGGPWWIKDFRVIGPITAIALGLVYLLAIEVRGDSRSAASTAALMRTELAAHQHHTEQLHKNIEDYMRVQMLLMRQLCTNAAKNADERAGCFKP